MATLPLMKFSMLGAVLAIGGATMAVLGLVFGNVTWLDPLVAPLAVVAGLSLTVVGAAIYSSTPRDDNYR